MGNILAKFIFAIAVSALLALMAYIKKALTNGALIVAFILSLIICFGAGLPGFLILTATLLLTLVADKIGSKKKDGGKEHEKRNIAQIICNVGVGTTAVLIGIIFGLAGNRDFVPYFNVIYAAVMAASLSDSMSSGIGTLSKKEPFDIIKLRLVEKGSSGGVSFIGFTAAIAGSAIIGIIAGIFSLSPKVFFAVTICGFLGSVADSVFGSLVQAKYRCAVCGKPTERKVCCGIECTLIYGLPFISNNTVNFMNNIFTALLAALVFALIK